MDAAELNRVLSDEIYKIRSGQAKPDRVNAVTRAASQIISAARLELQYVKLAGIQRRPGFFSRNSRLIQGNAKKAR